MERKRKEKTSNKGVSIRKYQNSSKIYLNFQYKGERCREPLEIPVTEKNLIYAEFLRNEIQEKIKNDVFLYADYFPKSKKLAKFGSAKINSTILDYLNLYLESAEKRKLSLDEAVIDGLIKNNPVRDVSAARYCNPETKSSDYIVDPFSPNEVKSILAKCENAQIENLFRFSFATGMRPSEICALKWSDIDFDKKIIQVNQAKVVGIEKSTKTKAGTRNIDLDESALLALTKQKKFSFPAFKYIFLDPKKNEPWASSDAIRKKAWVPTLKKAKVKYRIPYQMRHTFATKKISEGVNLFWLAQQMGHKGLEMLFRHYGSYLKSYEGRTDNTKK